MDFSTYEIEARVEATHWWFVTRRKLFESIISDFGLSRHARILDVGTSTGTNLRMLAEAGFANVRGLDLSEVAIAWCANKGLGRVDHGDIRQIPSADSSFDLVLATDVIEHVDDDVSAICELERVLKPGGRVLITVPAFRSLWGLQDVVSQHKRRYRKAELLRKIAATGFVVEECFYFNFVLFLPIWLARQAIRILRPSLKSENEMNSPVLNRLLALVFALDVKAARRLHVPFGVSLLATLRKMH